MKLPSSFKTPTLEEMGAAIESIDDFTPAVIDNTKDRISKIRIKMSLIEADYGGFSNIPVNHEFFDLRRELQQLERN